VSRALAVAVTGAALALDRLAPRTGGARAQQGIVLGALALGMPHGAADTELLRAAARGDRRRHAALLAGYTATALGATAVVRRGGPLVERAVLVASAAHFAEGELACWPAPPPGARRARTALRLLTAATTTLALPATVGAAHRQPAIAVAGADTLSPRSTGDRTGLTLLRDPVHRRAVGAATAGAVAGTLLLAATRDREPAVDSAVLTALALLAPPSTAFAAYFGGWHALRHTARVAEALAAAGQLPSAGSLTGAVLALARRSAWAAGLGVAAAGVLAARDPQRASDQAFAAVLGLTVPHMATVAVELAGRQGR
jgi:Brp/Blh family beta-carotene 15,15'-monooxygenase